MKDRAPKDMDAPLVTHAVLGYDAEAGGDVAHAFEDHGHHRRYQVRLEGRVWTFDSGTERARIEFSEDGSRQDVRWEWRPTGDVWLPLCDRVNVRESSKSPGRAIDR